MKALRWHGREDVRLDEVEFESALGDFDVEVVVACCGICGSDVAEFRQGPVAIRDKPHVLTGQTPPLTLGHEFSGRIVAVGDKVQDAKVGMRVAADATWRCGLCLPCKSGRYNLCAKGGSIGLASDGAFAERVRFPSYCVVPLPDVVSDQAGALIEPLAVALYALERSMAGVGSSVVILGFGPIGAAAATVASAIGHSVLVVELSEGRRKRAEELGFAILDPCGEPRDIARAVRARTGGGAEVVLECTGSADSIANAPEMTRRGGSIVVVGIAKAPSSIDTARLLLYERQLIGALGYRNTLPKVVALIEAGVLDTECLVTKVVGLDDAPTEFARLAADPGDDLKVLVEPRRS
jgi:(R,R)-butanediol dehydrogenase/meso-butanediol dehydrogenase/diacetyl reductase